MANPYQIIVPPLDCMKKGRGLRVKPVLGIEKPRKTRNKQEINKKNKKNKK